MNEKPAILKESHFTVEEGFAYRAFRTGAIWMNKLFFSCLVLLGLYLLLASIGWVEGCGHDTDCTSVFLATTSTFLGAMAILSFLLSLAFGALGLVVGKRILEMTPSQEEVGAARGEDHPSEDVPGRQP